MIGIFKDAINKNTFWYHYVFMRYFLFIYFYTHWTWNVSYKLLVTEETRITSPTVHKWFCNRISKICIKNKNVLFDHHMQIQLIGTAMRIKSAPPYTCLTVGYLEDTKLSPTKYQHNVMKVNASWLWNY